MNSGVKCRRMAWVISWLMFGSLIAQAQSKRIPLESPDFALIPFPEHVRTDGRDRIYVADPDEGAIRVFHKNGQYLHAIGSKGPGPGQFKRWFGTFTVGTKDNVFQVDFFGGNRWINVFDSEGQFKKTVPLDIEGVYGPFLLFAPKPDQWVMGYMIHWRTEKQGGLFMGKADSHVAVLSGEGKTEREVFKTTLIHEISEFPDREGRPVPAQNEVLAAIPPNQEWVVYLRSDEEQLHLAPIGKGAARTIKHGFKKRKVTKEIVAQFVEKRLAETLPEFRGYERRLYKKMNQYASRYEALQPIVDRIFFNPAGILFLSKQHPTTKQYDVIRMDLKTTNTTRFQTDRVPVAFLAKQAVFLEVDEEEGLATLVIETTPKAFQ